MRWNSALILINLFILAACGSLKNEKTVVTESSKDLGELSLNLEVESYRLENGLRLLIVENSQLPIFSYYTFYDVGGRHESEGTTGATHFLEHMMFKGAKKYGPGQFDSIIEGNGGSTNAYTTFDSTVYYQSIPSHMIEKIVDLEADRLNDVLLEPKSFENERGVIFNERKMRYENSPHGKLYYGMMQSIFKGTPYGGSVIGSVEDLTNLKRDDVKDFFHKFYTPDNAIIVIVGDVDAEETYELVKKKFGSLKPSSIDIKNYKVGKEDKNLYVNKPKWNQHVKINGNSPNPIVSLAWQGDPLGTRRGFVMDILSSILGAGESSHLYQKYVKNKRPLLNSISVGNYQLKHNGVFFMMGQLLKGVGIKQFRRRIARDSVRFCSGSITERTVQKTKNQYLIGYYSDIQTNAGVAQFLGLRESLFNDYNFYKKELDIYNSITVDEVKTVCNELFKGGKNIYVTVWDKHRSSKRKK
ncbi:MAG: insulinase family protein [Bacteriovoracaceae bacterium]|nr:insulinase family protein [Bacteriovoracaceae bacterium]